MAVIVSEVHGLVRLLMGDPEGDVWDDETLLPFTKRSYRKASRFLRSGGMNLFRKQSSTITLAIGETTLSRTVAPLYPSDMLRPIEMREKPTSSGTFVPMRSSDGFLPDRAAGTTLQIWDWRDDKILTLGASVSTDVQLQYEAELPTLTDASSLIYIPDGLDPVAGMIASMAARSREETAAADHWWGLAMEDLEQILRNELSVKRAHGARMGGQ